MSEQGKELVKGSRGGAIEIETAIAPIADKNIVAIADEAEARVKAFTTIKRVALSHTNAHDWVNENGKPYLQSSGAEKIAGIFGVSWHLFDPTIEKLDGGHILVTFKGDFSVGGTHIEAIGTRSSKDPFFKKYKWIGEEGTKKEKVELPASEIDMGDVIKSAYSNMEVNGITRLLGLRNLTWADLQEYAKIKQSDAPAVEYKKRGEAPSSQAGKAPPSQEKKEAQQPGNSDDPATTEQTQAINAILEGKGITGDFEKMQTIKSVLGLEGEVPTSIARLTKSQAQTAIAALQKGGGE